MSVRQYNVVLNSFEFNDRNVRSACLSHICFIQKFAFLFVQF